MKKSMNKILTNNSKKINKKINKYIKEPKREISASILKKMVSRADYGPTVTEVLSRILPPYLVKHFTLINEFLQFFDQVREEEERRKRGRRRRRVKE